MSNTSLPELPEPASPPPQPTYVDRSTGLVVFGIVQILFGALAALMIPLSLFGIAMSQRTSRIAVPPGSFVLAVLTYLAAAMLFITLGIGSIQARRWARALTLAFAWIWLITGFLITIFVTALLPAGFSQGFRQAAAMNPNTPSLPTSAVAVILTVLIVFLAVFCVLVPLAFVVFYRSRNVEETCRHKDPFDRWTDRCPLPVLAAGVLFASASAYYMGMSFTTPLVPFFGRYLTGIVGAASCLVLAGIYAFSAFALFRVHIVGWWVAVTVIGARIVSGAITYRHGNLFQAYSRMGWNQSQLRMMGNNPFYRSGVYWGLGVMVIYFCYLLWIKRYFKRETPPTPAATPSYVAPEV